MDTMYLYRDEYKLCCGGHPIYKCGWAAHFSTSSKLYLNIGYYGRMCFCPS